MNADKRGKGEWKCKCGEVFDYRNRLMEHVSTLNPHWPYFYLSDKHRDVTPTSKTKRNYWRRS